jgi:GDP-4-dehydro-6-deoxy-D-mannose reductase
LAEQCAGEGRGDVVIARVFNLCGPGQDAHHVCGALVRQIAAVCRGEARELQVGPRHPVRDFLDVRDAADALLRLAFHAGSGAVVNVGSGHGTSVAELLALLLQHAGLPPTLAVGARPLGAGVASAVADVTRLRALGYAPRRDLRASLREQLVSALYGAA